MAKHVITTLTSDLSGKPIDEDSGGGSVTLSLDGKQVEVDLTGPELEKLEKTLSQYFEKGRRIRPGGLTRVKSPAKKSKEELSDMRIWLRSNGFPSLGDRGRVPAVAQAAYESAH